MEWLELMLNGAINMMVVIHSLHLKMHHTKRAIVGSKKACDCPYSYLYPCLYSYLCSSDNIRGAMASWWHPSCLFYILLALYVYYTVTG
jgi:hypothetical protein